MNRQAFSPLGCPVDGRHPRIRAEEFAQEKGCQLVIYHGWLSVFVTPTGRRIRVWRGGPVSEVPPIPHVASEERAR
jgi:hypothetical protein